jgi:alanine racemase
MTGSVPTAGLEPVMRVSTRVLFVKDLPTGAPVSYGRSFVTQRPSRIATLPVGYADGYPRAVSGRASVLVHGQRCAVVGRVCMDLCMVDVTDVVTPVESGDEVVLLGAAGGQRIGASEVAEWANTIPYEILCGFSTRVPRVHAVAG